MLSDEEFVKLQVSVADQQVLIYALTRLLGDIVYDQDGTPRTPTEQELERARVILDMELAEMRDALLCKECGHALADHDSKGCTYIACRNVCGRESSASHVLYSTRKGNECNDKRAQEEKDVS